MKKKILFIISGSIAARKGLEAAKLLAKKHQLTFVLTRSAEEFVSKKDCEKIKAAKVYTELFVSQGADEMDHINLSRDNDVIVVAPASANLIAKMSQGIADSLASTLLLASNKKILLAPAMNTKMWDNKATQRNIKQLLNDGVIFIGPSAGDLACGENGLGRMKEAKEISDAVENYLEEGKLLQGKKIIVTAGPTIENIDPVRFISNHSSGKQGYAIAEQLANKGAQVILVSGPTNISTPSNVKIINIKTADEMFAATHKNLPADVFISVAAVADWKVKKPEKNKIKKSDKNLKIELVPNVDILESVNKSKKRPKLVIGFAAESKNLIKHGKEKLKKADWILANDIKNVFGSDKNKVSFITKNKSENWPELTKTEVAAKLAKKIGEFYGKHQNKKT